VRFQGFKVCSSVKKQDWCKEKGEVCWQSRNGDIVHMLLHVKLGLQQEVGGAAPGFLHDINANLSTGLANSKVVN